MATVTPRILPSTSYEIRDQRERMERELDKLLAAPAPRNIDNAPPTNYGFSTGYFLAYQGHNDASIKAKIYRLYLLYCPALQNGYFVDPTTGERHRTSADFGDDSYEDEDDLPHSYTANSPATAPSSWTVALAAAEDEDGGGRRVWGVENGDSSLLFDGTSPPTPSRSSSDSSAGSGNATAKNTSTEEVGSRNSGALQSTSGENARLLRVGFASRHLFAHQVGYLLEGAICQLALAGYIVEVFLIDGYKHNTSDPVFKHIREHVQAVHPLTADLTVFIRAVREAHVDVLFYPDLGLDPIPFFAAFSRLAPIQVTGLGHIDTSGLDTVDYFLSDAAELSGSAADAQYTERLFRLRGMGTCFVDRFLEHATSLQAPRTALLERAKYIESIGKCKQGNMYWSSLII